MRIVYLGEDEEGRRVAVRSFAPNLPTTRNSDSALSGRSPLSALWQGRARFGSWTLAAASTRISLLSTSRDRIFTVG
jgi:hypothetical protein